MEIVIARYNEDIDWVSNLNQKYIIYNKGMEIPYYNIKLDNIARESYTYLTHIINNYDNLSDYTVFLQGNPFDHSPNLFNSIENFLVHKNEFQYLTDRMVECRLSGCIYHSSLPLQRIYTEIFEIQGNPHSIFVFGAGAQFIVSKESILKNSKNFYEKLKSLVEKDSMNEYVLERFWGLIFNNHDLSTNIQN